MILYLDASALVKRYVAEPGSADVLTSIAEARAVGTVAISRAEVAAALAKAVRFGLLTSEVAQSAHQAFRRDWPDFVRLPVTEPLLERASAVVWDLGLRGYDAVQLAAGLSWQEALEAPVSFATFDRHLWAASGRAGLVPSERSASPSRFLATWRGAHRTSPSGVPISSAAPPNAEIQRTLDEEESAGRRPG